jgi:hypothetical protein
MTMRALLRCLFVLAALLVCWPGAPARAAQLEQVSEDGEHQILVMLRMAPPHFRPNSGYSGSYGDAAANAARRRSARRIAERYGLKVAEDWPMPLLNVDCFVMIVPTGMSVSQAIAKVSKEPSVAWSQPMFDYKIDGAYETSLNDPLFRVQPTAAAWQLASLQRVASGRGVKIAIVDSRIDLRHPDLAGQFLLDRDFVGDDESRPETHGTRVAGIIGAKAGNGIGIAGVAPGAKIMALRACRESRRSASTVTLCRTLALAKALQFAIGNGADVINLSLAGPDDPLLIRLVEQALARNVSVVVAFDRNLPQGGFPASIRGVIPVADDSLELLPDGVYRAPGRDVPTTQPGGGWSLVDGTSYAVAQISGLVALVDENRQRTGRVVLVRARDGTVDACATLLRAARNCNCVCNEDRAVSTSGLR